MKIVNLRQARKARARDDASKRADANRLQHGLSKSERHAAKAAREANAKTVEAHKRDG